MVAGKEPAGYIYAFKGTGRPFDFQQEWKIPVTLPDAENVKSKGVGEPPAILFIFPKAIDIR
jgi:hypothetical protein